MRLSPEAKKRWRRFCSLKRGYYSFLIFTAMVFLTLFLELFINSRALLVRYDDQFYFPTYGAIYPGTTFGLGYDYETNYRELKQQFLKDGATGNYVIMPLVPFNPYENMSYEGDFPPYAPSVARRHFLGTDINGRDIVARLVYGFRIAIAFSLILLVVTYSVGILMGSAMGYYGGWFDLLFQRLIEVWTNIPVIYVVIIMASLLVPTFSVLVGIMALFGWTGITWYVRTATYKEKSRDYVAAAKTLGASDLRIIVAHILPNTVSIIITFVPFAIASGITSLTALDYLGFGLPAPTPSWGEMMTQGMANLDQKWIIYSVVLSLVVVLTMVTFIGEAVREAFDPKTFTTYE